MSPALAFDGRWDGAHGIGRYSREVLQRLPFRTRLVDGAHPVSPRGMVETLRMRPSRPGEVFYTPGYVAPARWGGPVAVTVHDLIHLDVPEERRLASTLYYERLLRRIVQRAEVVLTVSEFSRDRLVDWAGLACDRVVVTGNGVSPAFRPGPRGPRPQRPHLLYVGNAKAHKNLPRLFQALRLLRTDGTDVDLLMVGESRPETVALMRETGLQDAVRHTGRLSEDQLAEHYRDADVVVMPSTYEGFGMPALEAMACGTPVVAGRAAAVPEVVGDAAALVDPFDVEAIAATIEQVLSDTALRDRLAAAGPQRAARFTWDAVAARVAGSLAPLV